MGPPERDRLAAGLKVHRKKKTASAVFFLCPRYHLIRSCFSAALQAAEKRRKIIAIHVTFTAEKVVMLYRRKEDADQMDDRQIIRLLFERSEQAISELSQKYGALCFQIAHNILNDHQDAEECVNDAWLGAWNSIPPQAPDPLRPYICRIVRNLSLKKLRANSALKRGSRFEVSLSELENCIPDNSLDEQLSVSELTAQIDAFLSGLSRDDRVMFVRRYWFAEPLSEIAAAFGITEHNASVRLGRIRRKLHQYLERKEVTI